MGMTPGRLPGCLHEKEPWRWAAHFPAASSVTGEHLKPLPLHSRWNQAVDEKWESCLLLQPDMLMSGSGGSGTWYLTPVKVRAVLTTVGLVWSFTEDSHLSQAHPGV